MRVGLIQALIWALLDVDIRPSSDSSQGPFLLQHLALTDNRIGDFADAALAIIFVVRKANQLTDAPGKKAQLSHMMRRIAIRTVVGIVPIVGDIAITFYRANTKNVCAIEDWLLQAVATANVVPEVIPGAAPEYAQQKAADQPQAQTRFLTADDLVHK